MPTNDKGKQELAKKAKELKDQLTAQTKQLSEMVKLAADDKKLAMQLDLMQKVLKAQNEAAKKIISNMK